MKDRKWYKTRDLLEDIDEIQQGVSSCPLIAGWLRVRAIESEAGFAFAGNPESFFASMSES